MTQFFSTQWTRVSAVAAITLLLAACGKGQQAAAPAPAAADKNASPPVAVVDGTPISRDAYDDYLKGLLRGKPIADVSAEEKNQVLDQMINMQLIAAVGEKEGAGQGPRGRDPPGVAAHPNSGRRRRTKVREGQRTLGPGTARRVRCAPPTRPSTTPRTSWYRPRKRPNSSSRSSRAGAKFEDVAKAESTDNSKAKGGDLGWFTTARMVKPFGDAVKGLKKGEITPEPVQTQYGWHIIKLEDTRDAPRSIK